MAQMKVGIFVTIALLLLAALILQQSWGIDWFSGSVKAVTYLPDVGGLKAGAPVWLAGIEIGKVRKVTVVPPEIYAGNAPLFRQIADLKKQIDSLDLSTPSGRQMASDLQDRVRNLKLDIRIVEVQLDIRSQYINRISRDSEVSIESRGLIGDSFIDISPGAYGILPAKSGDFYVIEGMQQPGFKEIMTGANDVVANFGVLSDQVKTIVTKINPEGVGSNLTQMLQDVRSALLQANRTFEQATFLIRDLRNGRGSFAKFVSDPALYNRMNDSLDRFNQIADQVQNGSGTIARLIRDPQLYDAASTAVNKAASVIDRIDKGEGTLGRLLKDPALYDTSKEALDRFVSLVNQIDQGNGTLGKLLKDPGLYDNLNTSSAEITKLIYDLRQDPKKYLTIRVRLF